MATGQYDSNAIVPVTTNITVGTTATAIKSSSSLMVKFIVTNAGANPIYVGDSNVASNRFTVKLTAGNNFTFGETKMNRTESSAYDLGRIYLKATAASQTATITIFARNTGGSTF